MRDQRFTFVYSEYEKRLLEKIATYLQRSKSDAVRYLIHEKSKEIDRAKNKEVPLKQSVRNNKLDE